MKIFITGATGLLGKYTTEILLQQGHQLTASARPQSKIYQHDPQNEINWVEADLLDINTLVEKLSGHDLVIHCAAMVSFDKREKEQIFQTNVEGTANLINAALLASVEKFIHVSSIAAVGRSTSGEPVNESNKWQESSLNTVYAESKYLAELEAWRGSEEGLKVNIINPSVILGIGELEKSSSQLFDYVKQEQKFYPAGTISYVDVRDVAEAISRLTSADTWGQRYIISAGETTYKDFFARIANHLGKKAPSIPVSNMMISMALLIFRIKSLLTGKPSLVTKETAMLSQLNVYFDNSKSKSALGLKYRDLNESLQWICEEIKAR